VRYIEKRDIVVLAYILHIHLSGNHLSFYKSHDEYEPVRVIPLAAIIDAIDIEPISKSKTDCFQVITEDKVFQFCANDEEDLSRWVGAIQSTLQRYRDRRERERVAAAQQ